MEFSCSGCDYTSFHKHHVVRHILSKCETNNVIEIPIEIKCEYCEREFGTRSSLKRHQKNCKDINLTIIAERNEKEAKKIGTKTLDLRTRLGK
jgi:hypothetical protein